MSYKGISDFRSDTVTRPTEAMRKAMYEAEVGDDVHGDDPTVNRLEELSAEKLGMEAGLFVPSGTMGNTIAMKILVGEGNVVILDKACHIFNFENGNVSRIAKSLPLVMESIRGEILIESIKKCIDNPLREHIPKVKAIALENTHNSYGGVCLGESYLRRINNFAKSKGLLLHLDGARIFNAAVAMKVDVKELTKHFDTVMFCLSKGLSAPVGSMLVGSRDFIKEARKVRKYLGGGMRQVGILAAAGIIAIEKMADRLVEDHQRAKRLATALSGMKGLELNPDEVQTNFLMVKLKNMHADQFVKKLKENRVLTLPFASNVVRILTHKDIDDKDIDTAINVIDKILK